MTESRVWTRWIFAAWVAAFAATGRADVPPDDMADRYQSIVDRNPFGLRPPKPEPKEEEPPPPPPPKVEVKLTGITTLVSPKKAYLMTKDDKGEIKYYGMSETDIEDGIEVLRIDEKKREVEIKNSGALTLLSFKTHGITNLASLPGKTPAPAVAGAPRLPPGVTAVRSLAANRAANSSSQTGIQLPRRTVRSSTSPAINTAGNRFVRSARPITRSTPMPESRYSAEEQVVMTELQKAANPDVKYPPMPPLPGMTSGNGAQSSGGPPPVPGR